MGMRKGVEMGMQWTQTMRRGSHGSGYGDGTGMGMEMEMSVVIGKGTRMGTEMEIGQKRLEMGIQCERTDRERHGDKDVN